MKRFAFVLAMVLGLTLSASAQQVSKAERDRLVKHLKQTEKNLKKETKGLSTEQWNFKQAPDRWSVKECLEHITLSEDFLYQHVTDRVMKSPAAPEKYDAAKAKENDEKILKIIPDRSQKAQAPEPLRPSGKWATPDEMWKHFATSRKKTIGYAKTEPDLRLHFLDSPVGGQDGYQWLLFLSAHVERHTKQIQEVKADANFPKK